MKSYRWTGWATAAVVTGCLFLYTGFINQHRPVYDTPSGGLRAADYSCGAPFTPNFPMDGRGPCTQIIQDARALPIIWGIVTVVLVCVALGQGAHDNRN